MKKLILLYIPLLLTVLSCKKEIEKQEESVDNEKIEKLVKKYNLKPTSLEPEKASKVITFKTVEEMELFFSKRELAFKPRTSKKISSTSSVNGLQDIGSEFPEGASSDEISSPDMVLANADTYSFSAKLTSAYWADLKFPNIYFVNWDYNISNTSITNITSSVVYTGSNFGSFMYSQHIASGVPDNYFSIADLNTDGIYTELYSIGIFSYMNAFKLEIKGDYIHKTRRYSATIKYTKL